MFRFSYMFLGFACAAMIAGANVVHAAGGSDKGSANPFEFVKMDPLLLPVIDEDGVQQVLSMVVSIEVDGVINADKVRAMKPRLADAYITNMYGILNEHAALKGGVVQVLVIKEHLNDITAKVLGDDIEADVLIQVMQQKPI